MNEPLTPRQTLQMEEDLQRLLPNGTPTKLQATAKPPSEKPKAVAVQQKTRGVWRLRQYPMGGWVYWQSPAWMQREDQGQDFEVPLGRHVIAPGWGKCVHHLSDREWPGGFGSPYAVVYIGSGRFASRLWYIGHCNAEVIPAGTTFHTGRILARPNHSLNAGRGWVELGHAPNGSPGPFGEGARFHSLFKPAWKYSKS